MRVYRRNVRSEASVNECTLNEFDGDQVARSRASQMVRFAVPSVDEARRNVKQHVVLATT